MIDYTSLVSSDINSIMDQKHQHKYINADKFKFKEYYFNENNWIHRLDGSAVIYKNGLTIYYYDGWMHRLDGPALIDNGKNMYYIMGKFILEKNFKKKARLFKYKCLEIFE